MILHKIKPVCFALLVVIAFIVASCLPFVSPATLPPDTSTPLLWTRMSTLTNTPTSAFTPTFTPLPTLTFGPTLSYISTHYAPQIDDNYLTPPPTISGSQVKTLIELLRSGQCQAPCYLSITPGRTTWTEATSIMETLGAAFYREKPGGQVRTHYFSFFVTDGKEMPTPTSNTGAGDREIDHYIALTIKDGVVQEIWVSIQTKKYAAEYAKYWQQYSIKEILLQNGIPDSVEFSGGHDIGFYYKEKGITIIKYVAYEKSRICPSIEGGFIRVKLIFGVSGSGIDPSETDASDWKPIDDILGISKNEFYNRIVSSTDSSHVCFNITQ